MEAFNMEWATVGGHISNWRKYKRVHQDTLALGLGLTVKELGDIEHGRKPLPPETKAQLESMGWCDPRTSVLPLTLGYPNAMFNAPPLKPKYSVVPRDQFTTSEVDIVVHVGWLDLRFANNDVKGEQFRILINKLKTALYGDSDAWDFEMKVDGDSNMHWIIKQSRCVDIQTIDHPSWYQEVIQFATWVFARDYIYLKIMNESWCQECDHEPEDMGVYINNRKKVNHA